MLSVASEIGWLTFHCRCYTTDPKKRWEECPVPICEPCLDQCYDKDLDPQGAKYKGCVKTTVTGKTCQVKKTLLRVWQIEYFARPGPPRPLTVMAILHLRRITVAIRTDILNPGKSYFRKWLTHIWFQVLHDWSKEKVGGMPSSHLWRERWWRGCKERKRG